MRRRGDLQLEIARVAVRRIDGQRIGLLIHRQRHARDHCRRRVVQQSGVGVIARIHRTHQGAGGYVATPLVHLSVGQNVSPAVRRRGLKILFAQSPVVVIVLRRQGAVRRVQTELLVQIIGRREELRGIRDRIAVGIACR